MIIFRYGVIKKVWLLFLICELPLAGYSREDVSDQPLYNKVEFNEIYKAGIENVGKNNDLARKCLEKLESQSAFLLPYQKAKASLLRLRLIYSDSEALRDLDARLFLPPDTVSHTDTLMFSSQKYLEKSMPDKAIQLLMEAISILSDHSDREVLCKIRLCEAYRQKREYRKGIGMLKDILATGEAVSVSNRVYAYNRLAAIFNESGIAGSSSSDSVIKYSELCISLSEKIGDKGNLAFSQNELSFQYNHKGQFERALELSIQAIRNFMEAGMVYCAMNALLNKSNIYFRMREFDTALHDLDKAVSLCNIEENRNLFMRIYWHYAVIYETMGKFEDAFWFTSVAQNLIADFYNDRINNQINEQSAKFDLLIKEQEIREEKQRVVYMNNQRVFLLISVIVLFIALIVSYYSFKLKRKSYTKQKLIEAIVETEAGERKRIARDLHDGLGPVLSAINHFFQAYIDAEGISKIDIESKMQSAISGAIDEVSRIAHNVSPHILEVHGLYPALDNFIRQMFAGNKIKIEFTCEFHGRFELPKELNIYRCITELLNNTLKHSGADAITLIIIPAGSSLQINYTDNGKGFEIMPGILKGMGIYNIKNRIEALGGSLSIDSAPGMGIKVNIVIPL